MAAPKQNQFWKLRSKSGRDKLFSSPQLLLKAAEEYFTWCDNTPWLKNEQLKKPYQITKGKTKEWVTVVQIPTQRPYTLSGFGLFCHASERYLQDFERGIASKKPEEQTEADKGFLNIIRTIRETIETQQLEGATVGAFNANIIARKLGLADKQEHEHKGKLSKTLKVKVIRGNDDE